MIFGKLNLNLSRAQAARAALILLIGRRPSPRSCSHSRMTLQPALRSLDVASLSLARLPANFGIQ